MVLLPNFFTIPLIGGVLGAGLALQQQQSTLKRGDDAVTTALKAFLIFRYGTIGTFAGYLFYKMTL